MSPDDCDMQTIRELQMSERKAANEAVRLALASYRWYGWSAMVSRFRFIMQACRVRLGMKLWP